MEDFSKQCQRFHHFNIRRIRDHVENRVTEQEFGSALEYLTDLKIFLKDNLDTLRNDRSWLLIQFRENPNLFQQVEDLKKSVEDKKDQFTEELNQLKEKAEGMIKPIETVKPKKGRAYEDGSTESQGSKTQQKIDKPNTVSKGIILHYLMEYGQFPFSTDNKILTGYLEKLELPTSEWNGVKTGGLQAYKKGTLALPIDRPDRPDRPYRPEKPGIITKQEFLDAINFLKTKDLNAYQSAEYDFNSYCREEMDPKEGNGPMFFKK